MESLYKKLTNDNFVIYNARNGNIKIHSHDFIELAYVQSGSIKHTMHGEDYILHAGDYFIIDHGMFHSYKAISDQPLYVRNNIFFPDFLDKSLAKTAKFRDIMQSYLLRFCYHTLQSDPTGVPFHDEDGSIRALLDVIEKEYTAKNYGYLELIRCVLVEILILTMRKIGSRKDNLPLSPIVAQMKKHVETHYQQKVQLSELAVQLGYTVPYLSQKFSKETGMTFVEYLHRVRVERSCHLLISTNKKVNHIAAEVGYESIKYFNQIFRQQLSITPREFRKIHRIPNQ